MRLRCNARTKCSLTQHWGVLWKTPALPRARKWNVLLNLERLHSTSESAWQLSLLSCANHPCVLMEGKKTVYRHDCSQNTGICFMFFGFVLCFFLTRCCPNPQLSGLGFQFHTSIVILNFTICTGPWRLQPSKVSVHGVSICIQYIVVIAKKTKKKTGNLQFRHDLDWILRNVRQVVTIGSYNAVLSPLHKRWFC